VRNIPKRPVLVGLVDGKLQPCPKYRNCVSTQSEDDKHKIDPLRYASSKKEALDTLIKIINSIKRTKIVKKTDDYIHAEFKTGLLKFVDDVEFLTNDEEKIIDFRSASRVGNFDWGTNRRRMEKIRKKFVSLT